MALSSLVYGLIESNQRSFTDSLVLGCLAAAAALLVVFVVVERRSAHPMFDLSLFRLPTFSGGLAAAFGLSASIFAMLLYLVLYLQDILGYSPLGTGVRLMVISGAVLVVGMVAGRLSSRVPVRLLIGPGLVIVGVGLLLMRGLNAGSSWTHLIPGMIVGGIGIGMVNPPLASTAVGVVAPQRAGMASGINSTFRQVGIATGIALLGSLFSNKVKDEVQALAAAVPGLSGQGPRIAAAVQSGQIGQVITKLPPPARQSVGVITRTAFTTGLNLILLVAAIIALVSGVVSLAAIRSRDFAQQQGPEPAWPVKTSAALGARTGSAAALPCSPPTRGAPPAGWQDASNIPEVVHRIDSDELQAARAQLVSYSARLLDDGLAVGSAGNISVRAGDLVAITPSGISYAEMTPEDICLVTMDGTELPDGAGGQETPSSETPMHLAIYATTSAAAVVHTHSPEVIALSATRQELPAIHYAITGLGGPVRVAPYVRFGSAGLAAAAVEALDGRSAVILRNHGAVSYGRDLAQAYDRSLLLEWLARTYRLALCYGEPAVLSAAELNEVTAETRRRRYGERRGRPA